MDSGVFRALRPEPFLPDDEKRDGCPSKFRPYTCAISHGCLMSFEFVESSTGEDVKIANAGVALLSSKVPHLLITSKSGVAPTEPRPTATGVALTVNVISHSVQQGNGPDIWERRSKGFAAPRPTRGIAILRGRRFLLVGSMGDSPSADVSR